MAISPRPVPASWQRAAAAGAPGQVLRLARHAAGLRQADLGARTGYSAATISRFETGARPLTDITALRAFCAALAIPPQLFGLAGERHAGPAPQAALLPVPRTSLDTSQPRDNQDGDGPVNRRELLRALASVTGTAMIGGGAPRAATADPRTANLHALLTHQPVTTAPPGPAPVPALARSVSAAQASFDACQYHLLSARLPALITRLEATAGQMPAGADRGQLAGLTAAVWCLASQLCVKLGEDAMAWVTADRALTAAGHSGDALHLAAASRRVSIAMRRHGHHEAAVTVLTTTALDLAGDAPDRAAAYASLLSTAAYTAAKAGHQHQALELIGEAAATAARLPSGPAAGFDADYVTQYQVGIRTCLGDPVSALDHVATLAARTLPTPQRRARYCIDTARAWHAYGRPASTLAALLAAEEFAAEEVNRPSVRVLTATLLQAPGPRPAALRDLAARSGAAV